jgi:para-nitrobenzyl esterase
MNYEFSIVRKMLLSAAVIVLGLSFAAKADDFCTKPVPTKTGQVSGMNDTDSKTCVWRGIPYAAAPIGDLRWKAPAPAKPWSGVREASHWGARCMQSGIMELVNFDPSKKMSEDCLFLNIWRPNPATSGTGRGTGKLPVMFWIHGGGYYGGTGNTEMYWGDRMAAAGDVVVVTINYRLNIFGFLALPALQQEDPNHSTGNYAMLDMIAALKWVHDNISSFGGDPNNVTIFGESAGGAAVYTLLATPLAKGLFSRAIMESGGTKDSAPLEDAFKQMPAVVEKSGCKADDLACLRKLPAKKVLELIASQGMGARYVPHNDGYFLTAKPIEIVRIGKFNNVPFIGGSNLNETDVIMSRDSDLKKAKPSQYQEMMIKKFSATDQEAETIAKMYPLSQYDNKPINAYKRIGTESGMGCTGILGAEAVAKFQKDVFVYRFDYHDIYWGKSIGAVHSLEMPFVFDTLDRRPESLLLKAKNEKVMEGISHTMQGYWVNFAKTGNPNGPGLPQWPVFKTDSPEVQVMDVKVRPEAADNQARCEFWANYNKRLIHGF